MKLNDAAEVLCAQLILQDSNLWLRRGFPELPVQVLPTPRIAGVIFEPSGIANRVDLQMKVLCQPGFLDDFLKKPGGRDRCRRFITMNGPENPNSDWVTCVRPLEGEARYGIASPANGTRFQKFRPKSLQSEKRLQEPFKGPLAVICSQVVANVVLHHLSTVSL
jgi:hypothetical protein